MNIGSLSNIEFVHRIADCVSNTAKKHCAAEETEFEFNIQQSEEAKSEQTAGTDSDWRWTSKPFYIDDFDSPKGYTVDMSALNKIRENSERRGSTQTNAPLHTR